MLAWLLQIPLEYRCLGLFLLGTLIGGQLNWAIYQLAWDKRSIGPWTRPHPQAPARAWSDYLPVFGWLGLSREADVYGRGFWVRPLLIELASGLGLAAYYYWEVTGQLIPPVPGVPLNNLELQFRLHVRFVSHALLMALMLVATFIDFDEKTIPDWITLPGTLGGLSLAFCWPQSLLLDGVVVLPGVLPAVRIDELLLTSPNPWPPALHGRQGLALGLFCYLGWCYAISPKRWTLRRGWWKALQYAWASTFRYRWWWVAPALAILGTPLVVLAWQDGGLRWAALLSALAGMAFGGALVWAVRVIGTSALGKEAMGFGDVTLMAMIGTFVGWQGALITFFVAPFAALLIALAQWLLTSRRDIAFGPYLCAGALYVLLRWTPIWTGIGGVFLLGWLIPAIVVVCLGLMWGMLAGLRLLRGY